MEIIIKNNNRTLIKENGIEININDGSIIQYTGIYYKNINDLQNISYIETTFIGIVETHRYKYDSGITGIYIRPLYILLDDEWHKIINFKNPVEKYFLYPHLLMLPDHNYTYRPLHYFHTCINASLHDYVNINKTLEL
jgi:hypothetical protein